MLRGDAGCRGLATGICRCLNQLFARRGSSTLSAGAGAAAAGACTSCWGRSALARRCRRHLRWALPVVVLSLLCVVPGALSIVVVMLPVTDELERLQREWQPRESRVEDNVALPLDGLQQQRLCCARREAVHLLLQLHRRERVIHQVEERRDLLELVRLNDHVIVEVEQRTNGGRLAGAHPARQQDDPRPACGRERERGRRWRHDAAQTAPK